MKTFFGLQINSVEVWKTGFMLLIEKKMMIGKTAIVYKYAEHFVLPGSYNRKVSYNRKYLFLLLKKLMNNDVKCAVLPDNSLRLCGFAHRYIKAFCMNINIKTALHGCRVDHLNKKC